jgi:uncharacterized protein YndB with AHSA1/START domain
MTKPEMKTADVPVLRINRTFEAPRERVFRAFTDPGRLQRWWGPEGMSAPVCELDPRPGGAWRTTMRSSDGKEVTVSGVYKEIDPPSRLVFTWAWTQEDGSRGQETTVTLEFLDRGEATELVLTQEGFVDEEIRGKHQQGWGSCFDCLDQALARGEL